MGIQFDIFYAGISSHFLTNYFVWGVKGWRVALDDLLDNRGMKLCGYQMAWVTKAYMCIYVDFSGLSHFHKHTSNSSLGTLLQ